MHAPPLLAPQAIERTYKGISKHFAEVFEELVHGGTGKLIMRMKTQPNPILTLTLTLNLTQT